MWWSPCALAGAWAPQGCSRWCERRAVPSRLLNPRDVSFVLYELLDTQALTARARYSDHTRETFDAALATAARIAEEKFAPHNRKADLNEPRFENGRVHIIPEVGEALSALKSAGFLAATQDFEAGGMQLPVAVAQACMAWFNA